MFHGISDLTVIAIRFNRNRIAIVYKIAGIDVSRQCLLALQVILVKILTLS